MWFIGLFVGLLLGSLFVGGYGLLWGGLLGGLAGALISYFRGQSRQPEIEARLAALEAAVRELRQKAFQTPGTAMPADVSQPAAPRASDSPETPFVIPQLVTEEIALVPDQPIGAGAVSRKLWPGKEPPNRFTPSRFHHSRQSLRSSAVYGTG
jgi:hypothetical protein